MLGENKGEVAVLGAMKSFHGGVLQLHRVDFDELSDHFIASLKNVAGPGLEGFVDDMTRTVKRFDPSITAIYGGAIATRGPPGSSFGIVERCISLCL